MLGMRKSYLNLKKDFFGIKKPVLIISDNVKHFRQSENKQAIRQQCSVTNSESMSEMFWAQGLEQPIQLAFYKRGNVSAKLSSNVFNATGFRDRF